jgi:P2-related tail formation protein
MISLNPEECPCGVLEMYAEQMGITLHKEWSLPQKRGYVKQALADIDAAETDGYLRRMAQSLGHNVEIEYTPDGCDIEYSPHGVADGTFQHRARSIIEECLPVGCVINRLTTHQGGEELSEVLHLNPQQARIHQKMKADLTNYGKEKIGTDVFSSCNVHFFETDDCEGEPVAIKKIDMVEYKDGADNHSSATRNRLLKGRA